MTTIVWDGKTLAADRQVNDGLSFDCYTTKIAVSKNRSLAGGMSGAFTSVTKFLKWVEAGAKGEFSFSNNDEGLLIHGTGKMELVTPHGRREIEDVEFYAIGAGREYAIGAMAAGATAEQAVTIAMKYTRSSGDINVVEFR